MRRAALTIYVFSLLASSEAYALEAMRGIEAGQDCAEIVEVEGEFEAMDTHDEFGQRWLITEEAFFRGRPAVVVYFCGNSRWHQTINFGLFSLEDSYRELAQFADELTLKYGPPSYEPPDEIVFKLLETMEPEEDSGVRELLYGWLWETEGFQIHIRIARLLFWDGFENDREISIFIERVDPNREYLSLEEMQELVDEILDKRDSATSNDEENR